MTKGLSRRHRRVESLRLAAAALLAVLVVAPEPAQAQSYRAYVAAESEDEVAVLEFTPEAGLSVEKVIRVGRWPAEIEGPHGMFFDPSGEYWYLTLGHGFPNGYLLKYETGPDTVVAATELGFFPATVSLTPDGVLAFAVNSNFYGDHVPSTVSVVDTEDMYEIEQVTTCTMPHGSRMSPDGMYNYSACMMDDQLVEMSTFSLEVTRRLNLVTGEPVDEPVAHGARMGGRMGGGATSDMAGGMGGSGMAACSPTWTTLSGDGRFVYVACNRGNEIVQVDIESWSVARRIAAEGAPYNLALTHDGSRLLATLKGSGHLAVWDLDTGEQLAKIESTQEVTHGVVVTSDNRFAFVTVEGIGGQPGIVEVIDLATYERVGMAETGKQAGGITLVPGAS
ncbi:MAG: YncE family protein [Gammaproteobacteria bacterium]|nr:YncE family protein [Gammaproteobacteria bacterium]MDE0259434.1 YncE family protein [Gammaproteobacteria bacterium]